MDVASDAQSTETVRASYTSLARGIGGCPNAASESYFLGHMDYYREELNRLLGAGIERIDTGGLVVDLRSYRRSGEHATVQCPELLKSVRNLLRLQ